MTTKPLHSNRRSRRKAFSASPVRQPLVWHLALYAVLCTILLTGCNKEKEKSGWDEIETYFDEPLASLSAEGDSVHWVGGEYGDLWRMTAHGRQHFKLGSDRIYCVVRHDSTYWIGHRNGGLTQYRFDGNALYPVAHYPIDIKELHYSVYDIKWKAGRLYAATSQGLFVLNAGHHKLEKIYPRDRSNSVSFATPLIANLDARRLALATDSGLALVDTHSGKTQLIHAGNKVTWVERLGKRLCYLAGDQYYEREPNGKERTYGLPDVATSFFRTGKTYCFLSRSRAILSDDLHHFSHLQLRRPVPSKSSHVVAQSGDDDFVWLVTDHAVWQLPRHLSSSAPYPIVVACQDDQRLCFVDDHGNVFALTDGSRQAKKIFDFIHTNTIVNGMADGGTLYYLDSQQQIFRLSLGNHLWGNYLSHVPHKIFATKKKVTAMGLLPAKTPILYIGVQDGMMKLPLDGSQVHSVATFRDKYVTSFYTAPDNQRMMIATLNDGLWTDRGDGPQPVFAHQGLSPRLTAIINSYPPATLLANNDGICLQGGPDTISVEGTAALLPANDSTVYALLERGIMKLKVKGQRLRAEGTYFRDIKFHPQASLVSNGRLYLGCDLGVLCFKAGNERQSEWIAMETSMITRRNLLEATAIVLGTMLLVYLFLLRLRRSYRLELRARQRDLMRRLEAVKKYRDILSEEETHELRNIETELHRLGTRKKRSWKVSNKCFAAVSERIMRLNSHMVIYFVRLVLQQIDAIRQTELFDAHQLIGDSQQVLTQGRPEQLGEQASRNASWLRQISAIRQELNKDLSLLTGTLPVEGISDDLPTLIDNYRKGMAIKTIDDMAPTLDTIRQRMERLMSKEVQDRLQRFVGQRLRDIAALEQQDKVTDTLTHQWADMLPTLESADRVALLRRLQHLDDRYHELSALQQLRHLIARYTGEERRGDDTHDTVHAIKSEINRFYDALFRTDPRLMGSILQWSNGENQPARVLALLLANPKVKRLLLPGMLNVASNLNPVISRLVKGKLVPTEEDIRQYAERHPSSIADYILRLME